MFQITPSIQRTSSDDFALVSGVLLPFGSCKHQSRKVILTSRAFPWRPFCVSSCRTSPPSKTYSFCQRSFHLTLGQREAPRRTQDADPSSGHLRKALTSGNKAVLNDIVIDQLKLDPSTFDKRLIPVCGDQMTIARLRSFRLRTAKDISPLTRHEWVLLIPQLWYMKWAFLMVISKCHWSQESGWGVVGMRHDAEALGRKLTDKCNFHPSHRFVEVRSQAMVLHAAR